MNTKILGVLLGFAVLGIAMTGGAAAADSTTVNELGTTTFDADAQSVSETPCDGCCCCPIELGVGLFDEARSAFVAGVEA